MKHLYRRQKGIAVIFLLLLVLTSISFMAETSYAAESYKGIAIKNSTKIYSAASSKSTVLISYPQGTNLKYTSYSSEWYNTTVVVNGKSRNGFISKSDVENQDNTQQSLSGITVKSPTAVYSLASTSSKKLKTYSKGTILKYKTFSKNWNTAVIDLKGKKTTVYLPKKDVENRYTEQKNLKGVALKSSTVVYSQPATTSKSLKAYSEGTVLKYKTFSKNWHEATVSVNGKATKGYIYKAHVENAVDKQIESKGIGLKSPTAIYSRASANSKTLKTYAQGAILSYKTLTSKWYETTVSINGKKTTGYIHTSHIEKLSAASKSVKGVALKTPTKIYALASKNAKVLKTYSKPDQLEIKKLSRNWYTVKIKISGKEVVAYVHNGDVSEDRISTKTVSYQTDFKKVVDAQLNLFAHPQVSGKTGGWMDASRKQVEYYANPSNFKKNSTNYYQFLVLSKPAGLNAKEVNQKVLYNHGILTGKAQSFINAGKKYKVNEAYLIAHALLETGNGRSKLATGIPVDDKGKIVSTKNADHIVYNMYGIGATDKCPESCGAKKAFEKKWFTPEAAIIGGADFIQDYIVQGQDTLYKMRWNPAKPGDHQYATDIGWAVKQTARIEQLYKLVDNFVLVYDVPKYANQPSSSGDPNAYLPVKPVIYPVGIYGSNIAGMELNLRDKPTTIGSKILKKIPDKAKIEILQKNGTWYKVKYSGKTGWVSGSYVKLLNLLEVKANGLVIREKASTSSKSYGSVNKGAFLPAVLDKSNKITKDKDWYKVTYKGKPAWIKGSISVK
ncbi:SH3 domain-containing protein [Planomicrobium sp. CPCC 101079]|uniref:SH3 domain-containing protein n=1 Tax=Planomicrobium sp. CPCC 101079 TaxID=2599618 RepID=UPI0011B63365|nr:SH3 domain-containing protein [Planomicrobium sp. CPCC 101079]TWT03569.1 SH3 domain-containing protein [Planomicrobium sp. CPCC 101079]